MNAVNRGPKNKKFNLWRCSFKSLQEISADEKGRLIQAVAHY